MLPRKPDRKATRVGTACAGNIPALTCQFTGKFAIPSCLKFTVCIALHSLPATSSASPPSITYSAGLEMRRLKPCHCLKQFPVPVSKTFPPSRKNSHRLAPAADFLFPSRARTADRTAVTNSPPALVFNTEDPPPRIFCFVTLETIQNYLFRELRLPERQTRPRLAIPINRQSASAWIATLAMTATGGAASWPVRITCFY